MINNRPAYNVPIKTYLRWDAIWHSPCLCSANRQCRLVLPCPVLVRSTRCRCRTAAGRIGRWSSSETNRDVLVITSTEDSRLMQMRCFAENRIAVYTKEMMSVSKNCLVEMRSFNFKVHFATRNNY